VATAAGSHIDREQRGMDEALVDAIAELPTINPTVDTANAHGLSTSIDSSVRAMRDRAHVALSGGGPRLARDRQAVLTIARYRIVPFRLLGELVFPGLHASVLTRRIQALGELGFVQTWEERLTRGGRPRYALLTAKGLAWAHAELAAASHGTPHAQLVRFMLGSRAKRPLTLSPNTAPPFLTHQNETNTLVAGLARNPELGITWASTWHRPFPNEIRGVALPQPDAVLVATTSSTPHLVFLEHDRNQESQASFAARKTQRYQLLLDLGLARELLGFETFTVWVTVLDPNNRRPLDRVRALREVSAAAPMFRFTLAGWAHAFAGKHWLACETRLQTDSRRPDDHELVGPFHTDSPSWTR
jgi:hypothetical protein